MTELQCRNWQWLANVHVNCYAFFYCSLWKKLFTNHLRGQTVFKYKLGIGCYRDDSLIVITFLNNLGKRKFQKKKMKMRTRKVMKKMAKELMRELPKITPWQGQLKKCFFCEWFLFLLSSGFYSQQGAIKCVHICIISHLCWLAELGYWMMLYLCEDLTSLPFWTSQHYQFKNKQQII